MSQPQIYIRGFPKDTTDKDLERLFERFGTIKVVRMINAYAFISYENGESAKEAVKEMHDSQFEGARLKVEIAGKPRKPKGPQADDQCRYCHKLGHWKNSCPEYRRKSRRRRSSSSDSSSSSDRHRRKKRHSKKYRRRSASSSSRSSSSGSSSSSSRSRNKGRRKVQEKERRKVQEKEIKE